MSTPMLKQYQEIKAKHRGEILFFRLGDFYEMFGPDAVEAARILNITLTARHKGTPNEMPMCGVPHHAVDNYLAKLTRAGKRVAICDQTSDPSLPGIVKREVVRLVTPGTTLDDNLLDNKNNNYLVSLCLDKHVWGLAAGDITTGEFKAAAIDDGELLKNEMSRLRPAEVIVPANLFNDTRYQEFINGLPNLNIFQLSNYQAADKLLLEHFHAPNLAVFGLENCPAAIQAAGNLLGYLQETQKSKLEHLNRLSRYGFEDFMVLDQATIRNLELMHNAWTGQSEGSLLNVIDQTQTAAGGRLLRQWLALPLLKVDQINQRLDAVDEIQQSPMLIAQLVEQLKSMADLERLLGRIGCNRAGARDLAALKNSLKLTPAVRAALKSCRAPMLANIYNSIPDHSAAVQLIEQTLIAEPPLALNQGGLIRDGFNAELDELRGITRGGKQWLAELQAKEIQTTGIHSLKIKFNKVFGYYIEISNANLSSVPENYIRKQTLVNAERYITPELKEYEDKILHAEEKIQTLEYQLFSDLREKIIAHFAAIQTTAKLLAQLDVLLGLAILAKQNNYCRPLVDAGGAIELVNSRHPVIEKFHEQYVPNNVRLNHASEEFVLLTGPNMSGKSSYLRQTALIVLMAQIGSFVPADSARIGAVDRIFTRVGASDNVAQGVSTFMNEMLEAGNILNNATADSLIILDELGRGTSTYDGLSIAWAIIEYIHDRIKAKTLFATHYHELVQLTGGLARAENYCVAVSEQNGRAIFLHKIIKGASSQSYGIEVAQLAGLPADLVARAREILVGLENQRGREPAPGPQQTALPLISQNENSIIKKLQTAEPNNLTPLQALEFIIALKQELDN